MEPLHITEFASQRYFDKLKKLNESGEPSSSSNTTTTTTTDDFTPELSQLHQTFSLPLRNNHQRHVDDGTPLALRPSEQKKRSLGHDLSTLRTQRRPTFTGSFGSLRSKVTITHKSPSIAEHHEQILAQDPHAPLKYAIQMYLSRKRYANMTAVSPSVISSSLYPINCNYKLSLLYPSTRY